MKTYIKKELIAYQIDPLKVTKLKEISNKDGVVVNSFKYKDFNYILKYFVKDEHKREIGNYTLLIALGMKTIEVINRTKNSLLLEDINYSSKYRLATKEDMNHKDVIKAIAQWYKTLHVKGTEYLKDNRINLYSELEQLTKENIRFLQSKGKERDESFWNTLISELSIIKAYTKKHRTITYNDFYYTNMIISKDLTEAFMFDYNLLGEGLEYFDSRNVTYFLDSKELFMSQFKEINPIEKAIDDLVSKMITLLFAFELEAFPKWGKEPLEFLNSNEIEEALQNWILTKNKYLLGEN